MTYGKNKKTFNAYTAEEFIAAITQHIPEKSFQMVRYYGWYSNKSRGMRLEKRMVRPGDEPLESDIEIEIIDVSVCRQAGLNISLNGSPLRLVLSSASPPGRMVRRGGKDLADSGSGLEISFLQESVFRNFSQGTMRMPSLHSFSFPR